MNDTALDFKFSISIIVCQYITNVGEVLAENEGVFGWNDMFMEFESMFSLSQATELSIDLCFASTHLFKVNSSSYFRG